MSTLLPCCNSVGCKKFHSNSASKSDECCLPTALQWVEFPSDPIYNPFPNGNTDAGTAEDYYPYVIYDRDQFSGHGSSHPYKMWHQGFSYPNPPPDYNANTTIALSHSNDGIHWTLESLTNLPFQAYHACVVYDAEGFNGTTANHYKIWFWTGSPSNTDVNVTLYAESNDGVTWTTPVSITQNPSSELVTGSGLFSQYYSFGFVQFNKNATSIPGQPLTFPYWAFYDVANGVPTVGTSQESIAVAYSEDGIHNWTRYGVAPVLIPSGTDEMDWDGSHSFRPSIVIEEDGIAPGLPLYHMYYSASNVNFTDGLVYAHGIGHALSRDGVTWARDFSGNPVFYYNNGKAWRSGRTYTPFVLHGNFNSSGVGPKIWKMWFTGGSGAVYGVNEGIGYATLS